MIWLLILLDVKYRYKNVFFFSLSVIKLLEPIIYKEEESIIICFILRKTIEKNNYIKKEERKYVGLPV